MKKTALLFAGQGAQYVGMGKDLYAASPEAASLFDLADQLLNDNFKSVCFDGPNDILTKTSYCQPALYVHGLALWKMLSAKLPAFQPTACAGLSLGEFTAHAAAGHLSFEDGLKLVHARGRLMQEACDTAEGGMVALVGATLEQAQQLAESSGLQVANLNAPGQIVLSGEQKLVPEAVAQGKEMGLRRVLPLTVAGAYHSRLMQPAQDGLKPFLEQTEFTANQIPVYANVSGAPDTEATAIRSSLLKQVTGSVLWQSCVENMVADGIEQFVELGPKSVLKNMLKRTCPDIPCLTIDTTEDLANIESL
ncbi:MAG: ACP S-malonyltransferase [Verrucomicrobiota bacterium]